jgi:DNA-binding NarL/FixJ family response regulator
LLIDTVRAGIIDDHEAVRIGFAASAARDARLNSPPVIVVGVAATVSEFLNSATGPGVSVALDMSLADGSRPGDNVERLVSAGHKVLVFTLGDNLASLQDALANGAMGVAHKSESMTQTFEKLRRVAAGETIASQELASAIDVDTEFVEAVLSERERECLGLYADGFGQFQVARRMGIAESTVKQNIDRVREKYAAAGRPAHTKIDLYRRAVEDGILPPLLPRRKP